MKLDTAPLEPVVQHAMDQYMTPGSTVLDVGANVGLWALRMSRRTGPGGVVHAFEPVPDTAAQLKKNLELSTADNVDDIWEEVGKPPITFVKIDIEGSEPRFLDGARGFFSDQLPVATCEINSFKLDKVGRCGDEIFRFFGDLGYESFRWADGSGEFTRDPSSADGDVLFVPRGRPVARVE